MVVMTGAASGCMATRKFVRGEVKTSSDALTTKIEVNEGQIKATQASVAQTNEKVAGVDQRVTGVDQKFDQKVAGIDTKIVDLDNRATQTTQSVTALQGDLQNVSGKADAANAKADAIAKDVASLDMKFQNRNNYEISAQNAVQFAFDSATLTAEGRTRLDEVAQSLISSPNAFLVLEGHTDSTGDSAYNIALGERRVEAVRRYLAVQKGIPPYRIERISFGADRPLAENKSRQGREQNRSVTLSMMVPVSELTTTAAALDD